MVLLLEDVKRRRLVPWLAGCEGVFVSWRKSSRDGRGGLGGVMVVTDDEIGVCTEGGAVVAIQVCAGSDYCWSAPIFSERPKFFQGSQAAG